MLVRRVPMPGEVGCPGHCPLCTSKTGKALDGSADSSAPRGRAASAAPPCLACRDEIRARLADMRMESYVQRAVN